MTLHYGSPSWTRTNDPVGLRCPTSACGGKPPCHMLTAAPSAAPFLPHSGQSQPQQLTAYASVTQGLRFSLFSTFKQKEKRNRKSNSFSFGSPSWTRTNDPVGLRYPTSACGGKPPCHMLTAAPSAAPFLPHSGQSHPQQLTAYASVTQGLRFFPFQRP